MFNFGKRDFIELLEAEDPGRVFDKKLTAAVDALVLKHRSYSIALANAPFLAQAFHRAKTIVDASLLSGFRPIEPELARVASWMNQPRGPMPHALRQLERIQQTEAFDDGEPDALAEAAACYLDMGAILMASSLLEQALCSSPDHTRALLLQTKIYLTDMGKHAKRARIQKLLADESYEGSAEHESHRWNYEHELGEWEDRQNKRVELCARIIEVVAQTCASPDENLDCYRVAHELRDEVVETLLMGPLKPEHSAVAIRAAEMFLGSSSVGVPYGTPRNLLQTLRAIQILGRFGSDRYRTEFLNLVEMVQTCCNAFTCEFLFAPPDLHGYHSHPADEFWSLCDKFLSEAECNSMIARVQERQREQLSDTQRLLR
ncbi:MAG: hypothetical protein ACPG4T_11450, partial [Nannocystaceae bacterium]